MSDPFTGKKKKNAEIKLHLNRNLFYSLCSKKLAAPNAFMQIAWPKIKMYTEPKDCKSFAEL